MQNSRRQSRCSRKAPRRAAGASANRRATWRAAPRPAGRRGPAGIRAGRCRDRRVWEGQLRRNTPSNRDAALTPHLDWRAYFVAIGLPKPGDLDIGQPEYLQALDAQLAAAPLSTWRVYLRWHLLHDAAPSLSSDFVDENFAFYAKALTGTEKLRERWKRVLSRVDISVGEALGQLYVAQAFPPESKARMVKLVGNLQSALRDRLR